MMVLRLTSMYLRSFWLDSDVVALLSFRCVGDDPVAFLTRPNAVMLAFPKTTRGISSSLASDIIKSRMMAMLSCFATNETFRFMLVPSINSRSSR